MQKYDESNLVVISGPSGVGKDSIIIKMRHLDPSLTLSVSATTRPPRSGEVDGVHYHFLDRDTFESKIANSEFLEYAEYCDNYYGTFKRPVEKAITSDRHIILKIDVKGAAKIKQIYPHCLSVFVLPPSLDSLRDRLLLRQLDDLDSVDLRVSKASEEIKQSKFYDFSIENRVVDVCARKILNRIYNSEEYI